MFQVELKRGMNIIVVVETEMSEYEYPPGSIMVPGDTLCTCSATLGHAAGNDPAGDCPGLAPNPYLHGGHGQRSKGWRRRNGHIQLVGVIPPK